MAGRDRSTKPQPVLCCYNDIPSAKVDGNLYQRLSESASANVIQRFTVAKCSGKAWQVKAGQVCRFIVSEGPQVGDVNLWSLHDHRERFYSGKTRQIHRTHLTEGDRLWSCLPFLRPLATITKDSMKYGADADGLGVHDVIGTRCDPYIYRLITGIDPPADRTTCHQNLTEAIKPFGLDEFAVHDVFNIFMCTGFDAKTQKYVTRGSPVKIGDHIEILAEMDLLVALSACPQGDVGIPCGEEVPEDRCFGLEVQIRQPSEELLKEWKEGKKES